MNWEKDHHVPYDGHTGNLVTECFWSPYLSCFLCMITNAVVVFPDESFPCMQA